MKYISRKRLLIIGVLILVTLLLAGCQPAEPEIKEVEVTVVVEPTAVPPEPTETPADQTAYHTAWESGPHRTYDQGHGPNDWCARCHSPQNWNPEATVGRPPNCVSCKFPGQEMTVGDGNVLIEEADWKAIPCETCHVMVGDYATDIAWLNPISMEYQEVSNSTELCEKCHVTTTGNAFGSAVEHKITLGGSAHLNYGGFLGEVPPPTYCTDCHDPHTAEPLGCSDCHAEDIATADHAGGAYGMMNGFINPNGAGLGDSLIMLSIIVLGGLGNMWGTVGAAVVILVLPEKLQAVQEYRLLIFAILVMLILRYRPSGILPRPLRKLSRFASKGGGA